jgi:hypothetical protein
LSLYQATVARWLLAPGTRLHLLVGRRTPPLIHLPLSAQPDILPIACVHALLSELSRGALNRAKQELRQASCGHLYRICLYSASSSSASSAVVQRDIGFIGPLNTINCLFCLRSATVVSKSVANPWRDPKLLCWRGKKQSKNGFANCVVNRRRICLQMLIKVAVASIWLYTAFQSLVLCS